MFFVYVSNIIYLILKLSFVKVIYYIINKINQMELKLKSEINLNNKKIMPESPQFGSQSHILQKKQQINASQKISQYYSECLNNNTNQSELNLSKKQKLYLLLLKFKLEELGFRKYEYNKFLLPLQHNILTMQKIQQNVVKICQKIIQSKENGRININNREAILQENINKNKVSTVFIQKNDYLFICPVCCDQIYESKLAKLLQCNHKFCDECIISTIQQSLKQAKYDILCLQIDCQNRISQNLIQNALIPEKFSRYQYFKKKKILQSDANNKFCTKPNCQGLLELVANKYKCFICNSSYCQNCLRTLHQGDCETHIQNIIQHVYINLKIKKCPKCKSPIEKSEGCNHMTCKKCSFQFCWICLGAYTRFHYRYYNCFGCPGMQFQDQSDQYKQRLKQILFFLLLPFMSIAIVSLFFLGLPIYIIIMILLRPYTKALESSYENPCCDFCNCYQCCDCCQDISQWGCKCLLLFFLYLPQGLLYGLFICPFKYFAMFYYQVVEIFD